MQQVLVEPLADRRRIEMDDGAVRGDGLDMVDGSEAAAVIETGALRQPIKALGLDPRPVRRAVGPAQHRPRIGGHRDPADGMDGQRLARQSRAAGQFPVAIVGDDGRAQLAHMPFVERQRAAHFDIEGFQHRGFRPAPARRGERGFEDRSGRQDRHAFDRVVGEPRQHLLVQMVEPMRHRPALTEAEQRVVERRALRIVGLDRLVEPEPLALPRIERQAARVGRAVEIRRGRQIVPGDIAARRDRRKRIAGAVIAGEAGDDPALDVGRAQPIAQIGMQDRARADFDKNAVALADQCGGGLGKAHRISDVAPPMTGIEHRSFDRGAGDARYQARRRRP